MCELCKGTHVAYEFTSFSMVAITCPVCGPISDEDHQARLANVRERIEQNKISRLEK